MYKFIIPYPYTGLDKITYTTAESDVKHGLINCTLIHKEIKKQKKLPGKVSLIKRRQY